MYLNFKKVMKKEQLRAFARLKPKANNSYEKSP